MQLQDLAEIGTAIAAALALIGAGTAWGVLRNRVANHAARLDEGDKRMDRIEQAVARATEVKGQVELLKQGTEASHRLLEAGQKANYELLSTKMDAVQGEVRSFMQGQASARRASPPRQDG